MSYPSLLSEKEKRPVIFHNAESAAAVDCLGPTEEATIVLTDGVLFRFKESHYSSQESKSMSGPGGGVLRIIRGAEQGIDW